MTDLVERARKEGSGRGELDGDGTDQLLLELADEVERLWSALRMVVTDLGEGVDPQEIRACVLDVLNYEIIRERSPVTRNDNPEPEITAGNGLITGRLRAND